MVMSTGSSIQTNLTPPARNNKNKPYPDTALVNQNCCQHRDTLLHLGHTSAYERDSSNQQSRKKLPCRLRHKYAVKTSKTCTPITCTSSPPLGFPEGILPDNMVRKISSTHPGKKFSTRHAWQVHLLVRWAWAIFGRHSLWISRFNRSLKVESNTAPHTTTSFATIVKS